MYIIFLQAEDGILDRNVTGVQTCALPISGPRVTVAVEEHISDNLAVRDAVLAWSRATDDGELGSLPRLLMGHSLGGLIAAESALRRPWDLSGLVLSSPGFVVGEDSPAPLRAMAPLVARLLPWLPVEKLEPDD